MKAFFWSIVALLIVGVFIILWGPLRFFVDLRDNNPETLASNAYVEQLQEYEGREVDSVNDVFQRLTFLDTYFSDGNSTSLYNGKTEDITYPHLQTLFGDASQTITDVNILVIDTVYQYDYDNLTLNFHANHGTIEEYVLEDYSEQLYNEAELDQLFIDAINHKHSMNGENESYSDDSYVTLVNNHEPSRIIHQNGWSPLPYTYQHYFDTGVAELAPEEYVLFKFKETDQGNYLHYMERRYADSIGLWDADSVVAAKKEAMLEFRQGLPEETSDNTLLVRDLIQAFGSMARLTYDFRTASLQLSWLIQEEDQIDELIATIPINESTQLNSIKDLNQLEVTEFNFNYLSRNDSFIRRDDFIASH